MDVDIVCVGQDEEESREEAGYKGKGFVFACCGGKGIGRPPYLQFSKPFKQAAINRSGCAILVTANTFTNANGKLKLVAR